MGQVNGYMEWGDKDGKNAYQLSVPIIVDMAGVVFRFLFIALVVAAAADAVIVVVVAVILIHSFLTIV